MAMDVSVLVVTYFLKVMIHNIGANFRKYCCNVLKLKLKLLTVQYFIIKHLNHSYFKILRSNKYCQIDTFKVILVIYSRNEITKITKQTLLIENIHIPEVTVTMKVYSFISIVFFAIFKQNQQPVAVGEFLCVLFKYNTK